MLVIQSHWILKSLGPFFGFVKKKYHVTFVDRMEEEVFVEDEPVEQDLVCPICKNPLLDPVLEPNCEQLLCRRCLTQCLEGSPLCPLCQGTTSLELVGRPPRFVTAKLNAILVVCPLCAGHVERGYLAQHKAQCPRLRVVLSCKAKI